MAGMFNPEFIHRIATAMIAAVLLGALFTELARRFALRFGLVAVPSADRWHATSTPLLGGPAVLLAFACAGFAQGLFPGARMQALLLAAAGMCAVGLVDDWKKLSPGRKLAGQLGLAAALLAAGFRLSLTGHPLLDLPLTLLWLVGITNAFNLLDNMNGLCAGIAVLAAVFRATLFLAEGERSGALVCVTLAGATLGFLYFNFPRGKIFLGDAGSLFLGFFLAGITLTGAHPFTKNYAALLLFPVLVMLVPILDTTLVTVTRRLAGRPVSVGGRDHVSHRLVAYGLPDGKAVVVLWTLALLTGSLGLLVAAYGVHRLMTLVAIVVFSVTLLGIYLGRIGQRWPHSSATSWQTSRAHSRAVRAGTAFFDLLLMGVTYHAAFLLRFEGILTTDQARLFAVTVAEFVLIKFCVFVLFGVYRRSWKYFGIEDAVTLATASATATAAAVLYFFFVYRLAGFSRVIFVLDLLVFTLLLLAFRCSFRLFDRMAPLEGNGKKRVVIYPPDERGELVLRCILQRRDFLPVGFLDDDGWPAWGSAIPNHRQRIHSIAVLGGMSELPEMIRSHRVEGVVLAYEAGDSTRRLLEAVCRSNGLTLFEAGIRIAAVPQHLSVRAASA